MLAVGGLVESFVGINVVIIQLEVVLAKWVTPVASVDQVIVRDVWVKRKPSLLRTVYPILKSLPFPFFFGYGHCEKMCCLGADVKVVAANAGMSSSAYDSPWRYSTVGGWSTPLHLGILGRPASSIAVGKKSSLST